MPMINRALFNAYSVTPTSYTYGYLSDPLNSPKHLITSGNSTTVSELNATDDSFAGFGVGDILEVSVDGTVTTRTVTSVSGIPDSVTVGSAVNWQNGTAGRAFSFRRFSSGTAADSGWFSVADLEEKLVQINVTAFSATSVDVTIEGRVMAGPTPVSTTIFSKSYTATGGDGIPIVEDYDQIRVGVKVTTSGGTNTLSAFFAGHGKRR